MKVWVKIKRCINGVLGLLSLGFVFAILFFDPEKPVWVFYLTVIFGAITPFALFVGVYLFSVIKRMVRRRNRPKGEAKRPQPEDGDVAKRLYGQIQQERGELALDGGPKSKFDGEDPNLVEGEDLDIPSFLRKKK